MQVGSYVVCVDDTNWDEIAYVHMTSLPKKNSIYKIRRIIDGFGKDNRPGIALVGIHGTWKTFVNNYGQSVFEEYHFKMMRFREIEMSELSLDCIVEKTDEALVSCD